MRAREPRADTVEALVESMTDDVVRDLRVARESDPHVRYMMFGHSFGTVLSLCVGAAVARTTGHAPLRAVLSAGLPPRLHAPADEAASLSDEELAAKLLADGGTAAELLSGGALTRYILRLFREDSTIRSQFCRQTGVRVDFPITLISAREDPHARAERMLAWSEHSSVPTRQVVVPGGHFAPVQQPATTIRIIRDAVAATAG